MQKTHWRGRDTLDTGIRLHNVVLVSVGLPVGATLVDRIGVGDGCIQLRLPLDQLQGEALRRVPANLEYQVSPVAPPTSRHTIMMEMACAYVTVQQPDAGVVSREGNHQVATSREHGNVPARGVGSSRGRSALVIGASSLSQNPEVVSVEMDRVSLPPDQHPCPGTTRSVVTYQTELRLNNEVDGLQRFINVLDVLEFIESPNATHNFLDG